MANHHLRFEVGGGQFGADLELTGVIPKTLSDAQFQTTLILPNVNVDQRGQYYCKFTYQDNVVAQSDQVTLFVRGNVSFNSITCPFYL